MLMVFRHVPGRSGIAMLLIRSFMQGYTLVLIENFYNIGIIYRRYFFTDVLVRNTVMVPVFSQGNLIFLLHFGHYTVLKLKDSFRQGLQQPFFFCFKKVFAAMVLPLKKLVVMHKELFGKGSIHFVQAKEGRFMHRSIYAPVKYFDLIFYVTFVLWPGYPGSHQVEVVMKSPLLHHFGKHRFIATAFIYHLLRVICLKGVWNTFKELKAPV